MDPEKFIELQKQMKYNHEEVADFLKDFSSWKETVDSKNSKMLDHDIRPGDLPAVRNSLLRKQRKKSAKKLKVEKNPQTERIKGSDYRAWDKFDVDKALVDSEEEDANQKSSSSSCETDEEMEENRRNKLAVEARDLGNLRFKEANYIESVEHYTTAIRLTPENPIPLINRAFAYLKLERFASAESDCSSALFLDPKCIKASFRRALARKNLQRLDEAIKDLKHILTLEPTNKAALKELATLCKISEPEVTQDLSLESLPTTTARSAPVSMCGNRKFRRIPITEVGGALRPSVPPPTLANSLRGDLPVVAEVPQTTTLSNVSNHCATAHVIRPSSCDISPHPSSPTPLITFNPEGPSNWYQLERELRELNQCAAYNRSTSPLAGTLSSSAVDYLCRIPPERYNSVIGSNLETNILVQFLHALYAKRDRVTDSQVLYHLQCLSKLPRFDVAWMLASDEDRTVFTRLIDKLEESDLSKVDLEDIKRCFD